MPLDEGAVLRASDEPKDYAGVRAFLNGKGLTNAVIEAQSGPRLLLEAGAAVSYLLTQNGDHEVDFILQEGRRVIAFEVKPAPTVSDADVRHLLWLKGKMGPALLDAAVITTGTSCYRRKADGIGVIPAALLGA